ncbi:MAG: aminotransferase class III-fold pyridoxal phosphate-dependent enzyme, partial [Pseudomonadales bacterium]|nr:aminotransferase class III-fold pyridoxal phosphate-dependent enzyme [Pseudomonadales bacterium]
CSGCRVHRGAMTDTPSLADRREKSLPGVLSLSYDTPLHIVRGRGQYLSASDGRAYLDLVNNVCHVGHCHPRVVGALSEQAARLNTNTRYLHETVLAYAERLTATLPEALDVCFLVNSGSEANELALRLARAATGRHDVLVIDGAYHGSTGTCVEMSPYKFNGPGGSGKANWVHVVSTPDTYRGGVTVADLAAGVGQVIGAAASGGRPIAAFFAESLLSCGGQIPLPDGYLAAAFEHVRAAGGVCIADEVQVGFGRVGDAMWGFELQGVVPDIVVMGKPIGNGHPLGAVVCTREVAEAFDSGMEFFSTFGGNPVSAAVGMAVLDVIELESLQGRAAELGARFIAGLEDLRGRHAIIGDVRGRGLFLGVELVRDHETLEPAADEASAIVNAMKHRGVLLATDGPLHNVIKIKPPMVLSEDDVDMALREFDNVLGTC